MYFLGILLVGIALVLGLIYGIWLIVLAFQRHILWGLAYLFVPFASIVFIVVAWEEAKRPFLRSLASGVLMVLGFTLLFFSVPAEKRGQAIDAFKAQYAARHGGGMQIDVGPFVPKFTPTTQVPATQTSTTSTTQVPMTQLPITPALQQHLAALRVREQSLLAKKAALKPGDTVGRDAVTREIAQYNAEREMVIQRIRQQATVVPPTP